MHAWIGTWVDGGMDDDVAERRACGSQLSPLVSSFDTYVLRPSVLLPSTAPLPGAHPISPVLWAHLSTGEMVQENVS